jgi:hypothetical protein
MFVVKFMSKAFRKVEFAVMANSAEQAIKQVRKTEHSRFLRVISVGSI